MRWTDDRELYLDRLDNVRCRRILTNEACWVLAAFSVGVMVGALIRPLLGGGI